jgi:stage III sporulation protein SpoIIIAA
VCIVDTSNEIGGEGDIPHTSIGDARRMMVTSLEAQARIMVRCVQVRLNTISATTRLSSLCVVTLLHASLHMYLILALTMLHAFLISLLKNHTPEVMVVDEIGRSTEVLAVAIVKARGVRMIASAHGSFKELYQNTQLKGLLGNFTQV